MKPPSLKHKHLTQLTLNLMKVKLTPLKLFQQNQKFFNKLPKPIFLKFKSWLRMYSIPINSDPDLFTAAYTYVQSLENLKASSRRTYYNDIIAGSALEQNRTIPSSPYSRRISKDLDFRVQEYPMKKAPIYDQNIFIQFKLRGQMKNTLITLTMICARLGNGYGFSHVQMRVAEVTDFPWLESRNNLWAWTYIWTAHKRRRWLGQRKVKIPIFKDSPWGQAVFATIPLLPLRQRTLKEIQQTLAQHQYSMHSIRRSGAHMWRKFGMPLPELMVITLHNSLQQLASYLEE